MTRLVLVLDDQLTDRMSAIRAADKARDVIVMAEVVEETSYVRHRERNSPSPVPPWATLPR